MKDESSRNCELCRRAAGRWVIPAPSSVQGGCGGGVTCVRARACAAFLRRGDAQGRPCAHVGAGGECLHLSRLPPSFPLSSLRSHSPLPLCSSPRFSPLPSDPFPHVSSPRPSCSPRSRAPWCPTTGPVREGREPLTAFPSLAAEPLPPAPVATCQHVSRSVLLFCPLSPPGGAV
jgi:hypothetical protein